MLSINDYFQIKNNELTITNERDQRSPLAEVAKLLLSKDHASSNDKGVKEFLCRWESIKNRIVQKSTKENIFRIILNFFCNLFFNKRAKKEAIIKQLDSFKEKFSGKNLSESGNDDKKEGKEGAGLVKVEKLSFSANLIENKIDLVQILKLYELRFLPKSNYENLVGYYWKSHEFKKHAETARIYYNANQLAEQDALKIIFQREPTNIAMGSRQYNKHMLNDLFGYKKGIFNDKVAVKSNGSSFKELPNTAAVYSETFLWNPPGGNIKKEIACLSLPAPALDSKRQPHFQYYMSSGVFQEDRYRNEMNFLFKTIEQVFRENKDSAFEGKGIQRLVLCRFGQVSFVLALDIKDRMTAHNIFKEQLSVFLKNIEDIQNLNVVMSEYTKPSDSDIWHENMIIGDIIKTAENYDLIINAWDPHSAPGNGNDGDHSFDGAMGKSSGILLTQTSWLNGRLRDPTALRPVA